MFNPVAPYRYLLPTMYLFMTDIANPDLFVCSCRTWISVDITHFYAEQGQPSSWAGVSIAGAGGLDTICTAVCDRGDRSTACRLGRLERTSDLLSPANAQVIYTDINFKTYKL